MKINDKDVIHFNGKISFVNKDLNDFLKDKNFELTVTVRRNGIKPWSYSYKEIYDFSKDPLSPFDVYKTFVGNPTEYEYEITFEDPDHELQFKLIY